MKKMFLLLAFFTLLFGCTNPEVLNSPKGGNDDNSIAPLISKSELIYGAYRGGSLIYNPDNAGLTHIVSGMNIPVRLASLKEVYNSEAGQNEYVDVENSINFGYLHINSVSANSVNFDYLVYDKDGNVISSGSKDLGISESFDINKDNKNDLIYGKAETARVGFENADYLTFISSKETLNTTMFSLSTEYYPENRYPSGIVGVNPSGKLIIQLDSASVKSRSVGENSTESIVFGGDIQNVLLSGDIVMDIDGGKSANIQSVESSRAGETVCLADFSVSNTAVNIYEVMYLNINDSLENLVEKYSVDSSRAVELQVLQIQNKEIVFFKNSISELKAIINSGIKIVIDGSASVNWDKISGSVKAYVSMTNKFELNYFIKGSYSNSYETLLIKPSFTFSIYGVPVTVSCGVSVGAEYSLSGSGTANLTYTNSATLGGYYNCNGGIKWVSHGWGWFSVSVPELYFSHNAGPISSFTQSVTADVKLSGSANGKIYLKATPEVRIAYILKCTDVNTFYITAGVSGTLTSSYVNGVLKNNATAKVSVKRGYTNDIEAGIDFRIDFGPIHWSAPMYKARLYDTSAAIYDRSWSYSF